MTDTITTTETTSLTKEQLLSETLAHLTQKKPDTSKTTHQIDLGQNEITVQSIIEGHQRRISLDDFLKTHQPASQEEFYILGPKDPEDHSQLSFRFINTNRGLLPSTESALTGVTQKTYLLFQQLGLTQDDALTAKIIHILGEWHYTVIKDALHLGCASSDIEALWTIAENTHATLISLQNVEYCYQTNIELRVVREAFDDLLQEQLKKTTEVHASTLKEDLPSLKNGLKKARALALNDSTKINELYYHDAALMTLIHLTDLYGFEKNTINAQDFVQSFMKAQIALVLDHQSTVLDLTYPLNGNFLKVKIDEARLFNQRFFYGSTDLEKEHQGLFDQNNQYALLGRLQGFRLEEIRTFLFAIAYAMNGEEARLKPRHSEGNAWVQDHAGWLRMVERFRHGFNKRRPQTRTTSPEKKIHFLHSTQEFYATLKNKALMPTADYSLKNLGMHFIKDLDGLIDIAKEQAIRFSFALRSSVGSLFYQFVLDQQYRLTKPSSPLPKRLNQLTYDQLTELEKKLFESAILNAWSRTEKWAFYKATFLHGKTYEGPIDRLNEAAILTLRNSMTQALIPQAPSHHFENPEGLLSAPAAGLESFSDFFIRYYYTNPVIGSYLTLAYASAALVVIHPQYFPKEMAWFVKWHQTIAETMSAGFLSQVISAGFTFWQLGLVALDTTAKAGDGLVGRQWSFLQFNALKLVAGLYFFIGLGKVLSISHIPYLSDEILDAKGPFGSPTYLTVGLKIFMIAFELLYSRPSARSFLSQLIHRSLSLALLPARAALLIGSLPVRFAIDLTNLCVLRSVNQRMGLLTDNDFTPFEHTKNGVKSLWHRQAKPLLIASKNEAITLEDSLLRLLYLFYTTLIFVFVRSPVETLTHHAFFVTKMLGCGHWGREWIIAPKHRLYAALGGVEASLIQKPYKGIRIWNAKQLEQKPTHEAAEDTHAYSVN